jgi:hypothetical protein
MSHGCGEKAWGRNSIIVHATARSPMGPYTRQKELLSYFAHEPTVLTLPRGGGYVLYKIGCADGAVTGAGGTGLVGPCTQCSNGTTHNADQTCPPPNQKYEQTCQDERARGSNRRCAHTCVVPAAHTNAIHLWQVLHATSLDGPWKRVNLSMDGWECDAARTERATSPAPAAPRPRVLLLCAFAATVGPTSTWASSRRLP